MQIKSLNYLYLDEVDFKLKARRALLLSATIFGLSLFTFAARQISAMRLNLSGYSYPYVFILVIGSGIALYMARKREPVWAGIFLTIFTGITSALLMIEYFQVIPALSGVLGTVFIASVYQVYPRQWLQRGIIYSELMLGLYFLLDLFWPLQRAEAPPGFLTISLIFSIIAGTINTIYILRQFPTYPFKTKLVTATMGLAIWTLIVTSLVTLLLMRNTMIAAIGGNLSSLARTEALALGELLAQEVVSLEAQSLSDSMQQAAAASNAQYGTKTTAVIENSLIAQDSAWVAAADDDAMVTAVLQNPLAEELQEYSQQFPGNVEVFITDRYGALLASNNRTSDFYQADESWWQEAFSNGRGEIYIGQPVLDDSIGALAMNIAVPIYDPQHSELIGILRTTYALETLRAQTTGINAASANFQVHLPNGSEIHLFEDNQLGSLTNHGEIDHESAHVLIEGLEQYVITTYDDEYVLLSAAPITTHNNNAAINALNWHVMVIQPQAQALTPLNDLQRNLIIFGIGTLLLAAITASVLGRQLVEPVEILTDTAKRVQDGDLTAYANFSSQDELGELADHFNKMTARLKNMIEGLEARVYERTRAMQIAAEVIREISTVSDRDTLTERVVNHIQDAFDYYHTQIYLLNDAKTHLDLVASTGEPGSKLKSLRHQLEIAQGLVGRAALIKQPILAPDVSREASWLPNEMLPNTRSELATPIMLGDEVLGVLDVQHDQVDGLSNDDENMMRLVAAQVAVALQNAVSYSQVQRKASQEEIMLNINRKIQATTDIESALQVAIRELGVLTGTRTRIRLTQSGENGQDES